MAVLVPNVNGSSAAKFARADIQPMTEMNTTPLIDVMLVLLIMFIITVPTQTDKVPVNLPGTTAPQLVRPLSNELGLSNAGSLNWNGTAIDDAALARLLGEVASRSPQPEVHFRPAPAARYERVDQVLAVAARSGATSFGFAGNERFDHEF